MKREIISIHIGEAGSQIGNTCWELYCLEHGFEYTTGDRMADYHSYYDNKEPQQSFFSETKDGKMKARALFVDLDTQSIDQIRRVGTNSIYNDENLISGKGNAGNNFAKGRGVEGNLVLENCLERIRKMVGECNSLEGFMITSSLNGGTGSGFRDALMQRLSTEFEKSVNLSIDVLSSPSSVSSCNEPYNVLLGMNSVKEYSGASIVLENEALMNTCKNNLLVERPKMKDLNEIIAYSISSHTSSLRMDGALNISIPEMITNLVPYPSIKYLISSMSPFYHNQQVLYERPTIHALTLNCFRDRYSALIDCNFLQGKYTAITIHYRGDLAPKEVSANCITELKRTIKFVDWSPTGFKCGMYADQPKRIPGGNVLSRPRDVSVLANGTCISQTFSRIENNFDTLFSEKAFIHWYLQEGLEEDEFTQCREEMCILQSDYLEMARDEEE